jgi:hypothetical protein
MLYLEIIHFGVLFLQHHCHVVNQLQAKGIFGIDFLKHRYHKNDKHQDEQQRNNRKNKTQSCALPIIIFSTYVPQHESKGPVTP